MPASSETSPYDADDSPTDMSQELRIGQLERGPPSTLIHRESLGIDEASRLEGLATEVRDQDDLERDINRQADQLLIEKADERDLKRLDKTRADEGRLQSQLRRLLERQSHSTGTGIGLRLRSEISHLEAQIRNIQNELEQIQERIEARHQETHDSESKQEAAGNRRLPNENQREYLIRTGKITPFSKLPGRSIGRSESNLQESLLNAEGENGDEDEEEGKINAGVDVDESAPKPAISHRNLLRPGFRDADDKDSEPEIVDDLQRPTKRRRLRKKESLVEDSLNGEQDTRSKSQERGSHSQAEASETCTSDDVKTNPTAESEDCHSEYDSENESCQGTTSTSRSSRLRERQKRSTAKQQEDLSGLDDGNERLYQNRLQTWADRRSAARASAMRKNELPLNAESNDILRTDRVIDDEMRGDEWHLPHPAIPDAIYENGFRLPGDICPSLFDYQKTGVQWLWELYSQQVGGIVGDEMGLGKTIQIIAFLAGLHYSRKMTKPIIVVAPATVMRQWVNEFHTWWPPFRVSILHTSGSGMIDVGREAREEYDLLSRLPGASVRKPLTKAQRSAKKIVEQVVQEGHVLVTTYSGLQTYADMLIPIDWEYAVLDEGHKIRNPNTAITIYSKELRTANRVILSGTPMQNNLVELWSLFDFVFPMRLGTLVNFRQQFEFPIRQGGYANASNLQVQTAMKCAETLKDTISPYLLQRFKADVASDLPRKSEQVLFCKLTKLQRESYETFLSSEDLKAIMNGKRQILYGVDILRKICNHPDLVEHKTLSTKPGYNYGNGATSGKMQVVKALLELWKDQGHKTLLFAQHRIMLDILEKFIRSLTGFNLRRMDGTTPISTRQSLVDEFNDNPMAHVFLLTTKVGGLGINLTGADRVIIYDPDWNPSTDVQARERAWRLGQKREVMIYRLMTAGTIEEKIYHRQLFKQFLINKVLRDPKQRQTFQMKDLHDLFTFGGSNGSVTETSELFKGTEVQFGNGNPATNLTSNAGILPRQESDADAANVDSVRNLTGVASMEKYHDDADEQKKTVSGGAGDSDSRVMQGIFARAGVHAALEHDQIVNGRTVIRADPKIIEAEAKRVAAEAAKELKKAGEAARNIPVGTPTWTGQFGTAGRPEQRQRGLGRGRGGPSSSSILAGLQSRQGANDGGAIHANAADRKAEGPRGTDFMQMIRDYLVTHGGQVHTQMLIDHFNHHCNSPEKTAEFKAMLTEIALLQKGTRGRGRWILKEEYA